MCKHCALVPIIRLVALAVLAVGVAACLVGFVSPFWAYYDPGLPCVTPGDNASTPADSTAAPPPPPLAAAIQTTTTPAPPRAAEVEGLWGRCDAYNSSHCTWFCDDNFKLERCFPSIYFYLYSPIRGRKDAKSNTINLTKLNCSAYIDSINVFSTSYKHKFNA